MEVSDTMIEECSANEDSTLEDEYCSDEGMCQRHWKTYQEWLCNEARADERQTCIGFLEEWRNIESDARVCAILANTISKLSEKAEGAKP